MQSPCRFHVTSWAPVIRLVSRRIVAKRDLIRFNSVSSLGQLPYTDVSDSGSDNKNSTKNHAHQRPHKMTVVTETLDCLMRKPTTAAFFIDHLKECGFKHDVFTYIAIIRFLCYWGMIRTLNKMIIEVIEDEVGAFGFHVWDLFQQLVKEVNVVRCNVLVIAVDGLIKAFVSIGRFNEALDMLLKIEGGFLPYMHTCNLFLDRLVKEGEVDMALVVYGHLKMNSFCPDEYMYMILINGLIRKKLVKEASDLYTEMEKAGVDPESVYSSSFINGLCSCGMTNLAFEFLKRRGSHPFGDDFAYSSVIRGFVKESKLEDAEDVMKQSGIIPGTYCYGALIQGYCKKGKVCKAVDLHAEMSSKGIKTNCVILTSIMQCLCSLGYDARAGILFMEAMGEGVFLDEICFNIAIDALCKLGMMDKAIVLLEEMKFRLMKPGVKHYTALINGYCNLKDPESALRIFNMMNDKGLKRDAITLNALIAGFSRCGLIEECSSEVTLHYNTSLRLWWTKEAGLWWTRD